MTIEQTAVDSNRLLTHAKAVGCTLERRESNTRGRSLICPLLCQGNSRKQKHTRARDALKTYLRRRRNGRAHFSNGLRRGKKRKRRGESSIAHLTHIEIEINHECGGTTEESRRL